MTRTKTLVEGTPYGPNISELLFNNQIKFPNSDNYPKLLSELYDYLVTQRNHIQGDNPKAYKERRHISDMIDALTYATTCTTVISEMRKV